jgi:uncharacterized protein YxeA
MKKVVIWMIAVVLLVGSTATAFHLGKNSETAQQPQKSSSIKETPNSAEIEQTEIEQNGIILFNIEDYSTKHNSVVLEGKKCGAFLSWTPDEDFVTSDETPAVFDISNEVIMDYYTGIDYGIVELTGGEVRQHYVKFYRGEFIYLHLYSGKVVYIQQALRTPY